MIHHAYTVIRESTMMIHSCYTAVAMSTVLRAQWARSLWNQSVINQNNHMSHTRIFDKLSRYDVYDIVCTNLTREAQRMLPWYTAFNIKLGDQTFYNSYKCTWLRGRNPGSVFRVRYKKNIQTLPRIGAKYLTKVECISGHRVKIQQMLLENGKYGYKLRQIGSIEFANRYS